MSSLEQKVKKENIIYQQCLQTYNKRFKCFILYIYIINALNDSVKL